MSVWIVCPSARPVDQVAKWAAAWRERGYKIAIWRDRDDGISSTGIDAHIFFGEYPGYAQTVNRIVLGMINGNTEWFIAAGDDVYPDPNHTADEIAAECRAYFRDRAWTEPQELQHETFGVMQPTGDRWGTPGRAYIDHVAGSAWIGREFAKRVNQGRGPLWPEYFHMGVDEELQAVATKLGVFWQRSDLIHEHRHWGREPRGPGKISNMPEFLKKANSREEWDKYKLIFAARQAAGFPGSEPL